MKFRSVLFNFASCAGRNKKRADGSSAIFGRWLDGAEPVRSEHDVLRRLARTVLFPLLCVGFATLFVLAISHYAAWKFESMVFLIPVVVAAARWGVVSAMVGAIASVAVSDFLFIPPFYSFIIYDPQAVIDLLLFFFVALVTSNLAARLRNEVDASRRRESEIHNLYEFSHGLALSLTAGDLVEAMQSFLSVHLGCEPWSVLRRMRIAVAASMVPSFRLGCCKRQEK